MIRPDPDLARRMNTEMVDRLGTALRHLVFDVLARSNRVEVSDPLPAAYGLQGILRDRALAGDLVGAGKLLDRFSSVLGTSDAPEGLVRPLTEPWFSSAEIEILQKGFSDDMGLTAQLRPPTPKVAEEASRNIDAVLACMSRDCPDWYEEFRTLVQHVVLASAQGDRQSFAGASAFDLWGAILVNPSYRCQPLHLAMTLVHESSHLKLFHAYLDDEVVLNDPEERYSSPLRREPRPMNGLYHAAVVLARMAAFATEMLAARTADEVFGKNWREQFQAEARSAVASFWSAHEIIARHGRLTPKGAALLADTAAAVAEAQGVALVAEQPALLGSS